MAGELVRADVDPRVSGIVLGRVAGLSVVGTPWLEWSGSEGVSGGCVGARLGWGVGGSVLSPGEVGLAAGDTAAASVGKKRNEKDRQESLSPLKSMRGIALTEVQY